MRLIDADEMQIKIASLSKLARSDAQKSLMGRVLYIIDQMPTIPEAQWISVEDNPPGNEYDFVLAYKPYLHEIGGSGMTIEHPWFVRMNKTYKYWMPMPEGPRVE